MSYPGTTARNSAGFSGTTGTSAAINAPSGSSVYAIVAEYGTALETTGVTDSQGNSYTDKGSYYPGGVNVGVSVWVADNITGSAALTVRATLGASRMFVLAVLIVSGDANPSFGNAGANETGTIVNGAAVNFPITPTAANGLLLLLMAMGGSASKGVPAFAYSNVVGETLETSAAEVNTSADDGIALGIYSIPSGGLGVENLVGIGSITGGTARSATYAGFAVCILPSTKVGVKMLLMTGVGP